MVEDINKKKKKPDIIIPRETTFGNYEIPKCLESWSGDSDYGEEYKAMVEDISAICDHLCKLLNEGPETKDSLVKRSLTIRAIFRFIFQRAFLNNFTRLGILEQVKFDVLYGQEMIIAMKNYKEVMKKEAQKANEYAS